MTIASLSLLTGGCSLQDKPYHDATHFSSVFGREKTYRIYLPDSYNRSEQRYPVIYFFHGWGGRHYKDDSAKLEYDKLGTLVNKYRFILVMWDGNMEESEPRPYNIGDHKDIRYDIQIKDYFPELINHIDTTYQTLDDRNHRGIIGFSMGGIMAYYLAGKYPDMVSAAVNMVGSPEFFIGLSGNHTLYPLRYTFDNLRDVALLFHNREQCQMSGLNDEVHMGALWSGLQHYEYHKLEGGHKVDESGETIVFESAVKFVIDRFENPVPLSSTWSHCDLYPEFTLHNYSIKTNKKEPGFIMLRNVSAGGFGLYTRKWLPEGPAIAGITSDVITSPIYEPGMVYTITNYKPDENALATFELQADDNGRLHFEQLHANSETGISKNEQHPGFVTAGYSLIKNRKFLRVNEENELSLRIFNRSGEKANAHNLKLTLFCADSAVYITSPSQEIQLKDGQYLYFPESFVIASDKTPPPDGSPEWLRLDVLMEYDTLSFHDNILLPVFYDVPIFENIQTDDGRYIASAFGSGDNRRAPADSIFGKGNGDGIVNPGEQILLYKNGHRLRLFTDDPYVESSSEILVDEILPAIWPDGFTLSSAVKIAGDCPAGHEIEFLARYETKTHMPIYRKMHWGKVIVTVKK